MPPKTPWSASIPLAALTARSRQWSRTWQPWQMALASAALTCSPGLGEEPLGVLVAAGRLVQPPLRPVVLDHKRPRLPVGGGGGGAVDGAQRPQDLPDAALADADDAGHLREGELLAALDLPQPPEVFDALGAGEAATAEGGEGAAHVVLAHADIPCHRGRIEGLAMGDLVVLVELLDALQRPPGWRGVVDVGAAAAGVGGL